MDKVRLPVTDDGFIVPQLGHSFNDDDAYIELSAEAASSVLKKYFTPADGKTPTVMTVDGKDVSLKDNAAINEFTVKVKKLSAVNSTIKKLEEMTKSTDDDAQIGFVNNHVSDDFDGRGDGKWYVFGGGKKRHKGDDLMTMADAKSAGIEIG